jgi:hypothetical protein
MRDDTYRPLYFEDDEPEDDEPDKEGNPWRNDGGSWSDQYLHMTQYARQYQVDLYRRNNAKPVRPKRKAKRRGRKAKKQTHWWSLK